MKMVEFMTAHQKLLYAFCYYLFGIEGNQEKAKKMNEFKKFFNAIKRDNKDILN